MLVYQVYIHISIITLLGPPAPVPELDVDGEEERTDTFTHSYCCAVRSTRYESVSSCSCSGFEASVTHIKLRVLMLVCWHHEFLIQVGVVLAHDSLQTVAYVRTYCIFASKNLQQTSSYIYTNQYPTRGTAGIYTWTSLYVYTCQKNKNKKQTSSNVMQSEPVT